MQSLSAVRLYQLVLLVSIVLNVVVGIFIMLWPGAFTALLGQPDAFPDAWPRHWGFQLLAINALYLPGLKDPFGTRWPNWSGIVIRLVFAAFFFSQGDGFISMGIYDGASGLLLLSTYLAALRGQKAIRS